MRVIEITGEPILHGGQEKFLENVIGNIDMSGMTIDVLTPYNCDNAGFVGLIESKGGRVYSLGLKFKPGKSRRLLLKPIKKFLEDNSYDVVHIHSGSISVLAYVAKAANSVGVKKIIVHSHSSGVSNIKHKLIHFYFGFMLKSNATDFLACSKTAGVMKYPKSIVIGKLLIIKNGINVRDFQFDRDSRTEMRKRLGVSDYAFVIGHVGRFSEEKNHRFLIDVFSEIHKVIVNSKLVLIGDGDLKNDIKNMVMEYGLEESVVFTGNVDSIHHYYQMMDVFVLPSIYEGLPFVALEAQATGIPCVFSKGVPETAVLANNVYRIDIKEKAAWVELLLSQVNTFPQDNSLSIRKAGFDIMDTVGQIKRIYIE